MQFRFLIATCLACSAFGCAVDPAQQEAAATRSTPDYRTGSRLPTYEPASTSSAKEVTKDDWIDERRNNPTPVFR